MILHYGGRNWLLSPELTSGEVVLRAESALHARGSEAVGARCRGGEGWFTLPLAGGGAITLWAHEDMNLVLEDDSAPADRTGAGQPGSVRRIR